MKRGKKHVTRKTTKPRKPSKTYLRNKCDSVFSKLIRLRDGRCMACGAVDSLQCSHHVSRKYLITRWLPSNAVAHCMRCHLAFTHSPLAHRQWIENHIGIEALRELEREALRGTEIRYRPAYDLILANLLDQLRALEEAA